MLTILGTGFYNTDKETGSNEENRIELKSVSLSIYYFFLQSFGTGSDRGTRKRASIALFPCFKKIDFYFNEKRNRFHKSTLTNRTVPEED